MDHLYAKNPGCGNMDTTKWEFQTTVARDTLASNVGHYSRMQYMAVAMNESVQKTRMQMIERMVQPCGPPPKSTFEDNQF